MRYDSKKIEQKWQKKWLKEKIYEPDLKRAKRPFYNLMMFPYPSAEGLHVGNMYAFVGADIYGRLKRMQGYDVFEPIGLDGFGIHSENYALKIGKHPAEQTKVSEKNFYRQLEIIGNGFAWDEKLETYDPDYYKWSQWIFIQMYKHGLAYRKKAQVNWCPSCLTVLSDEQVLAGECERCETKVIKKELEQWFFRITNYAERLLKNLEKIDWSERIKIAQRNWIGKSEGAIIDFPLKSDFNNSPKSNFNRIKVFTTRPDTLFGATYMVLAPEHALIENYKLQITNYKEVEDYIKKSKAKSGEERVAEGKEKTGIELKGIKVINPANNKEISIWVADYVLGHVGTGAIMAVPAHDERDFEFAKKYNLPIKKVVLPNPLVSIPRNLEDIAAGAKTTLRVESDCWTGVGELINSGEFTGMDSEKAKGEITKFVGGAKKVQYRLRDWLISRQRYWGPPIPMIYCQKCARLRPSFAKATPGEQGYGGQDWQPVPEKDLPVRLPYIKDFRPTGTEKSPLAVVEKFYKVRCPKCRGWARRETDVSDTFLDSAWYYLRYIDHKNSKQPFNKLRARKWFPVDMYIGGAEHAVLHLLYVRFLAMAFYDWGLVQFEEPFKKFRAHGLLIKDGAKMSKSRGNVVNPDEYIRVYGADALRMYLMFLGPFEQGGDFRDTGIRGITRFLERVWRFANAKIKKQRSKLQVENQKELERSVHKTIKKVTEDIEGLQYNTAISALMILLNKFEEGAGAVSREHLNIFLKLLAPFAPYISEELWQPLNKDKKVSSVHVAPWPQHDPKLLQENVFELVVQINGKVRDRFLVSVGISEEEVRRLTLLRGKVKIVLGTKEPRRVVFVPGRLINIVM